MEILLVSTPNSTAVGRSSRNRRFAVVTDIEEKYKNQVKTDKTRAKKYGKRREAKAMSKSTDKRKLDRCTNVPSSSTPHSPEIAALVDAVKAMLHQKSSHPASVKAVEEICVTCGGPHPYHQYLEEEPAPTGETSAPPAPKTAKQLAAKKESGKTIKSRFGGNKESKKMQKKVLKHQFENFSTASNESLDKAYDRFQKLISQLEIDEDDLEELDLMIQVAMLTVRVRNIHQKTEGTWIFKEKTCIDEYAIRKKIIKSKTTDLNTKTSETVGVLTRTGLITPVKQNEKRAVHKVSAARPVTSVRSFAPKIQKLRWVWRPKEDYLDHVSKDSGSFMLKKGNLEILLQDHPVVDSGCSSHMTGNKAYLSDYEDFNGGFVTFGSDPKGALCFLQVILRAPRKDDVYNLDLKNIVLSGGITCLYANAIANESKLWHRRLGHLTKITNIGMSELEKMIAQEVVAKALDDVTRQAFEEEKRNIASQKRAAQTTSINKLSTGRSSVSTATTPYVSAASTLTGANAGESSFVYT
ncbi:hypothetical protein Tco_1562719 [Tanacetum coccineum]